MTTNLNVPAPLATLWRQRARLLASNVATGGREHREIAHAAALIGADYHGRVLVELIQNANDQALRGGVPDSTVVIIRSQELLAVANSGQVVTSRNLERISSLADSDKNGVLVGNKGVGFKAVYEVADEPEIYSAAEAAPGQPQLSLFDGFGVGISLARNPFDNETLVESVEADIRTFFEENAGLASGLAERGGIDPLEAIRSEYAHVAGFKFPLPRDRDQLDRRVAALRVPESFRQTIRTLVVLPLRNDAAKNVVERAVDCLVGDEAGGLGQAELAVLFLTGVGRLIVIDRVRDRAWTIVRTFGEECKRVREVSVCVTNIEGREQCRRFWMLQRDTLDCPEAMAIERRRILETAPREFGLEAWSPDDLLPVTVALPIPLDGVPMPLGPSGRFCLGLPSGEATGLPVHVDARFFATISRTGLDFSLPYNAMLLDVATELFGDLLAHLRRSDDLTHRRAATLALQRFSGALADRVYASDGLAQGQVMLAWEGEAFVARAACSLPNEVERTLLPFLESTLATRSELVSALPEAGLLAHCAEALQSLGLSGISEHPHPWLARTGQLDSVVEEAARRHRADGPGFWEPFVTALLACFTKTSDLEDLSWLPVGEHDLAAPAHRVFLPAPSEPPGDEEEVANVPPEVASLLRLMDPTSMRLREDGRTLTSLASRLADARLVRRPRKVELLEDALFPVLDAAAGRGDDLALELFAQAVQWITSLRPASRLALNCKQARVPVTSSGEIRWEKPDTSYLGSGWGLADDQDRLLEHAYGGRRLIPFDSLRERFGLGAGDAAMWRKSAETLGVRGAPIIWVWRKRQPPLESAGRRLLVKGTPTLGNPGLDPIYRAYLERLAREPSGWDWRFDHDVEDVRWVDGLEDPDRRQYVVSLMLTNPELFTTNTTVGLRRVGHTDARPVPQMWVFALSDLGWPVFPAERGAGREPCRASASHLWRLPDAARRMGFAQLLNVVPHALSSAAPLLSTLGVPSIDDAPLGRLFAALSDLAERLDEEHLQTNGAAFSLAKELFARIDDRLEGTNPSVIPEKCLLPLLRNRRLHAVDPSDDRVRIAFDDDPSRGRHVEGNDTWFRVPLPHDATMTRLYEVFTRAWGAQRVLRTSAAKVSLQFNPNGAGWVAEPFLDWLGRVYSYADATAELAALLTYGGERALRSERVGRNWKSFERLMVVFGSFGVPSVTAFYDRPSDRLWLETGLPNHQVVAATWELAGARARDLWAGYAHALSNGTSRAFLQEHDIGDVEIIEVADAAGLYSATNLEVLKPALLAAWCHHLQGTTLDEAAAWFAGVGTRVEDVATALGCPELGAILTAAIPLRAPQGELSVLRHLGVPWGLWQEAVLRQYGRRHTFSDTVSRFEDVRCHLVAVAREIGARDPSVSLDALGATLTEVAKAPIPEDVEFLPIEAAGADKVAYVEVMSAVSAIAPVHRALRSLPLAPWDGDEFPIPKDATRRGVRLFREVAARTREIEARTSVYAVIQVACRLAPSFGEGIDSNQILVHPGLTQRQQDEWAHVYAALHFLRELLESTAPETVKKLSSIQAFREPSTSSSLLAKLPEVVRRDEDRAEPRQEVLGLSLTDTDLRKDLRDGSGGALGAILVQAATKGLDSSILAGVRRSLDPRPGGQRDFPGGGRAGIGGGTTRPRREGELVGDIGEAFVHEWLTFVLGADYGPDCWVSHARERYGLPPSGNDALGYDFRVPDPEGRLFGRSARVLQIEVKSTSGDGAGPFPMSRSEWEEARRCHEVERDATYVILRVFDATKRPRIGDVVIDPFGAFRRGEVRLAERDMWVTVSPLVPALGKAIIPNKVNDMSQGAPEVTSWEESNARGARVDREHEPPERTNHGIST